MSAWIKSLIYAIHEPRLKGKEKENDMYFWKKSNVPRNIKVRVGRWNRIRLSTLTKKGKVDKTQFSQGLRTA